ncbi:hypothetical protein A4G19_01340 [Pasteurellaceae bacterium Macca]|nr:hypothetical protein [Pasteurellaceae bacterium Macca]
MNAFLKKLSQKWLNIHIIGALPIFFAMNLGAVTIWALDISAHAMPFILGIIAGGLADLDNRLTGRLKNLFFTLIAFAISALSSQLALSHGWLFIPLITAITFVVIMLGTIGQRYSTIAFSTLLVAVYTTLSYNPDNAWYSSTLLILFGALIYGIVAVVVYLCFPNRAVQENMASYFEALSHYLFVKADFFDPDDTECLPAKQVALAKANMAVMQSVDKARVSLFYRLRGQHRHLRTQKMLRYYFAGQEIWEKVSSSHSQYQSLFQQLHHVDIIFRLQRLLELQGMACQQIAQCLRHNEEYQHSPRGEKVLTGLFQSLQYHQSHLGESGIGELHRVQSIAENLQNVENLLAQFAQAREGELLSKKSPKTARLLAENVSGFGNMLRAIRNQCHFGSPLFRHGVRLSIVVFVCSLIAEFSHIEQGHWILLTALLVCQPNYSATKKRLIQRVAGTVLGVIVGLSLRYLSPTLEAQLGLIVASSSLFFFFRTNNYGFSTFFITLQVLVSFDVVGYDMSGAMLPRIFDTFIGAGIAWLAVSYLWPDWKYLNLNGSVNTMLNSFANYLQHIIAQLQFGYRDQLSYRIARREAQNAVANFSTVVSNIVDEPKKYQQILHSAPQLLGLSYTLLSYISTLGAHRIHSQRLNKNVDLAAQFFQQSKHLVQLLQALAGKGEGEESEKAREDLREKISRLDQQLQGVEQQYQGKAPPQDLILLQQLHLIAQLLSPLQEFRLELSPQVKTAHA